MGEAISYVGTKTPREEGPLLFDFTDKLGDEEIQSIEDVTAWEISDNGDETEVTADVIDSLQESFSGKKAYPWIKGGTHGKMYLVAVKVKSSPGGAIYEGFARFRVIDPRELV